MRDVLAIVFVSVVALFLCCATGQFAAQGLYASPSISPSAGTEASAQSQPHKLSEQEVKSLVALLGDKQFKTRQSAQAQLIAAGADIIPMLVQYRNDADPEIAARVEAILANFSWYFRGAIVVKILADTPAQKAGIRPGDVLVKRNGTRMMTVQDVNEDPDCEPNVFVFQRDAKCLTITCEGRVGVLLKDWDKSTSSKAKLIGLHALEEGDLAQAYPALRSAADELQPAEQCALAVLAENAMDHKFAMEIYRKVGIPSVRPFEESSNLAWTSRSAFGLEFTSLHTAFLLEQAQKGKISDGEAALWLIEHGRNIAYARTLAAKQVAKPSDTTQANVAWHSLIVARARIAMYDRDWNAVLEQAKEHPCPITASLGVLAAIEKQDVDKALQLAALLVSDCKDKQINNINAVCVYALAAGYLAGKDAAADALLEEIGRLSKSEIEQLFASPEGDALEMPSLDAKITPFLQKLCAHQPYVAMSCRLLRRVARTPDLTPEQWQRTVDGLGEAAAQGSYWQGGIENALVICRFGQYQKFSEILQKELPAFYEQSTAGTCAKWLSKEDARLAGPWSQLKGTYGANPGRQEGSHWAVRWDGQVFFADAEGKITSYPGIDLNAPLLPVWTGWVWDRSTGTVLVTGSQIYLLDEKLKSWAPTFASPCYGYTDWKLTRDSFAPVLKYLMSNYPANTGQREIVDVGNGPGCVWWLTKGNVGLVFSRADGKITDLSSLGARPGKAGEADGASTAKIFRMAMVGGKDATQAPVAPDGDGATSQPSLPERLLISSDRGLWIMDERGKIEQADLGPANAGSPVVIMDWLARPGKAYVGLPPQFGGQVFEMDLATGRCTLTGGYCGQGTDNDDASLPDASRPRRCDYALSAIYAKSQAQAPAK